MGMNRAFYRLRTLCFLATLACNSDGVQEPTKPLPPAVADGATAQAVAPRTDPARVAIRHILIAHADAQQRASRVGRSQKAASDLANDLRDRILGGESMSDLAKRYSNDPTAARGGFLGASEKGAWVPAFEQTAFALEINALSEVIKTPYGFHVLRREPLQEVKLLHLLIAHQDAKNVAKKRSPIGKRSRKEAEAMAVNALTQLKDGQSFQGVAAEFSDGPMGKRGADLGWFVRGELGPSFDAVAYDLDVGQHSEIIESVFGFHLIQRLAP
jgi:parvulin-like peptidyl-prolyl isomerase